MAGLADFTSADLLGLVRDELAERYGDHDDVVRPDPGDIVADALEDARSAIRIMRDHRLAQSSWISGPGSDGEMRARAMVLGRLADWMEPVP